MNNPTLETPAAKTNMPLFQPKRVFIEGDALDYPLTQYILARVDPAAPVEVIASHNRVTGIPGKTPPQKYKEGKRTLVIGVKRDLHFDSCRPSADFEFSLATGCPGGCQYCYLQTHLGPKPYIRVYVNLDEILQKVSDTVSANEPGVTTFEAASAADPLAVEHLTGSLARTIEFFGDLESGRLRAVTKFAAIDPLLQLRHRGHTRFRFSLNSRPVIERFEHNTAPLTERITAAAQMARADYPVGFIIAPLFIYPDYQRDYEELFQILAGTLPPADDLTFELITHRFTTSAKRVILERFPQTALDLDETKRRKKFGRYGLSKYLYPDEPYRELKEFFINLVAGYFPLARVEYFT